MANSGFLFGGVLVPNNTKRIYVTATLVPSMGDPRIQPTGFPDIGPVFYADPSGEHGQICLIESEASMANRLEEVCVADKYTGTLVPELAGLPYIRVMAGDRFMTASTLDGHRFASEYIMKARGQFPNGPRTNGDIQNEMLVDYVKRELDGTGDNVPAANVPRIFRLAMELDPLSLIHGFQISLKNLLTFVGLRSPRALTSCIVGLNAQPVGVPGVRIDPIGTGDAGQAIFRKERIVAQTVQANFAIDVGLLSGLAVGSGSPTNGRNERRRPIKAKSRTRPRPPATPAPCTVAVENREVPEGLERRTPTANRMRLGFAVGEIQGEVEARESSGLPLQKQIVAERALNGRRTRAHSQARRRL